MPDITIPEAAVEAAARELALLDEGDPWPSNVELGGHPLLGTRDDEYRHGMREQATELLTAAAPHIAAQALRDAADQWQINGWAESLPLAGNPVIAMAQHGTDWLRARADRIEADHG